MQTTPPAKQPEVIGFRPTGKTFQRGLPQSVAMGARRAYVNISRIHYETIGKPCQSITTLKLETAVRKHLVDPVYEDESTPSGLLRRRKSPKDTLPLHTLPRG